MKSAEIRRTFLDFFADRGHQEVASASLIPHNDPTLFFVNAGMVPFKDLFTGAETRSYTRATSVQKCLRVSGKHNDLEAVGRTPRHHTFFEMLGNFSFGDYFKSEAIPMAWELLRGVYQIPEERLWVTVFEEDDEAFEVWRQTGVAADRIQRLGAKDNFWSMGPTGPCGPCTEIFYDHGPKYGREGGPAVDEDRYVEIWNLVLMQFEQHADGTRTSLPKPSIDTGSGLERVAAALQGHMSNYDTDVFQGIIQRTARLADVRYGADHEVDTSLRVIADHARASAFLISDGIMPSNLAKGYVLRRIMRRAIRFGVKIGMDQPFFHEAVDEVVRSMGEAYPELRERKLFVDEIVQAEEQGFRRTLSRGMTLLNAEIEKVGKGGKIPGDVAFQLSDTYGFPHELTELIAAEQGVGFDKPGFDTALAAQRARGRAGWKGSGQQAVSKIWKNIAEEVGPTSFVGYDTHTAASTVVALVKHVGKGEDRTSTRVDSLTAGDEGTVIVDLSPLYGEGGGQVGDTGAIGSFTVTNTGRDVGLFLHHGKSTGTIEVGQTLSATSNQERRAHTERNHTATHLLHAVLRAALGEHVAQKGSLVGPSRLRFDFSHHKPLSPAQIRDAEDAVNAAILKNIPVTTGVYSMDEAKALGAMALFGEKYGDRVRVVNVPGASVELCGGTHVRRTGDIGLFRIVSESGIAAGVRRIEAQTGVGAVKVYRAEQDTLVELARTLKSGGVDKVPAVVARLVDDKRRLDKQLAELKRAAATAAAGDLLAKVQDVGGISVLVAHFDGDLKEQADRLREQLGSGVIVLGRDGGKSVQLVAAVTKDLAGTKVHAGNIIKSLAPIVGGRGGGRPDLAQGGGKDASKLQEALDAAIGVVTDQLA